MLLKRCLTHWGRVVHRCVDNLISIGRRQAIIWTNAGILLTRTLWTIFSETLNEINTFSFRKMHCENVVSEMATILSRPQCCLCCGVRVLWLVCLVYAAYRIYSHVFLAATKQLYEWYFLSVYHTFLTMFPSSYHHEIFRSYHKGPG